MTYPTLERVILNRFYEAQALPEPHINITSPYDESALQDFNYGLKNLVASRSVSSVRSSTISSFSLEDEEIKRIFADPAGIDYTPRQAYHNQASASSSKTSRSSSLDELNPNAQEFVPSQTIVSRTVRSHQLLRPVPGPRLTVRIPRWRRIFERAVCTSVGPPNEAFSQIIATCEAWDYSTVADLAQEFAWCGVESDLNKDGKLAAFATAVFRKLQSMKSPETANAFQWYLGEMVLRTYNSVWDTAIDSAETISYTREHPRDYVNAAIILGEFIGGLFDQGLLTPANVTTCINTVLKNVVSVEHVEAVRALVTHAGDAYWYHNGEGVEGIDRFHSVLIRVTNPLKKEMTVLTERRPLKEGEVHGTVADILILCDRLLDQSRVAMARARSDAEQAHLRNSGPMPLVQYSHGLYNHVLR